MVGNNSQELLPQLLDQQIKKEVKNPPISIGTLYPTGEVDLPPLPAHMENPYFDPTTSYLLAVTLGVAGGGTILKELLKPEAKFSRRNFLKLASVGAVGSAMFTGILPNIPGFKHEVTENLRGADLRLYSLVTDFPLLNGYLLREKVGTLNYLSREKDDEHLLIIGENKEEVYCQNKQIGIVHKFTIMPQAQAELLEIDPMATDTSGTLRNNLLMVYEATKGSLIPTTHPNSDIVSSRLDVIHKVAKSPVVACFNATAPQALGMCETIRLDSSTPLDPWISPVVYGSSSLFIPDNIPADSPIWIHANNKLSLSHPYFPELSYRKGDPSHQAIGFNKDNSIRIVKQDELEKIVADKQISSDLAYVALNQFCFDPRENTEIPPTFKWGSDIHRNCNILLVTDDDKQMIMSSSLDFFLRNSDYLSVIRRVESYMGVTFKLAACMDVGLAAGFSIQDDEGKISKPVEPSFHNSQGELNIGMAHTSSIYLTQQGIS